MSKWSIQPDSLLDVIREVEAVQRKRHPERVVDYRWADPLVLALHNYHSIVVIEAQVQREREIRARVARSAPVDVLSRPTIRR